MKPTFSTPVFLSWRTAAARSSFSESSLRRLVRDGKLSPPVAISRGRVAFDCATFDDELAAHVRSLNRERARPAVEAAQ